jgi:hypothetical protein
VYRTRREREKGIEEKENIDRKGGGRREEERGKVERGERKKKVMRERGERAIKGEAEVRELRKKI